MSPITLDLLVRGDGAEDDFGELASLEWFVCDSPHNLQGLLDYSHAEMRAVVYQARNIVLWHFGQLFLEYAFKTGKDDCGLAIIVVVDHPKLDLAIAFFDDGGLSHVSIRPVTPGVRGAAIVPFREMVQAWPDLSQVQDPEKERTKT